MNCERKARHTDAIVKHYYRNAKIRTVKFIEFLQDYHGDPSEGFPVLCCEKCYFRDIEKDKSFWFTCGYCMNTVCMDYDNFFDLTEACSENICLKCILHSNVQVLSTILLEYCELQSTQIESLLKENARLQDMVDYQPGGQGFVEAKEHYEQLLKK